MQGSRQNDKGEIWTALKEQFEKAELGEESIVNLRNPMAVANAITSGYSESDGLIPSESADFNKEVLQVPYVDRCERCGEKGHIAEECNRDSKFLLGEGKEGPDNRISLEAVNVKSGCR